MTAVLKLATDVNPAGLADGDLLQYEAATGKFKRLAATVLSGDVTGNGNLTGNLRVQGTLTVDTAAIITGTTTQTGQATFVVEPIYPATTKAAAGTVQGNATALVAGLNKVTGADGTKGVALPTAAAGVRVHIANATDGVLKLYPASGDKINGGSTDASINVGNLTACIVEAYDATEWYTFPKVPS